MTGEQLEPRSVPKGCIFEKSSVHRKGLEIGAAGKNMVRFDIESGN